MIKKLFRQGLLVCSTLLAAMQAQAQVTINTPYTFPVTPTTHVLLDGAFPNRYVTFSVENANNYPILITDVSSLHISSQPFTYPGPVNVVISANGATYELWQTSTWLSGAPNISTATGWTNAQSTVYSGGASFGVEPIFKNLAIVVPSKSMMRFAVVCNDSIVVRGRTNSNAPAPRGFTAGGVRLHTVDTNQYTGVAPNAGIFSPSTTDTFAFEGNIKFYPLNPPVLTVNPTPACKGSTVIISAKSSAYFENPVYTWYDKNGNVIPGQTDDTLIIPSFDAPLAGQYCATVTGSNTTFITEKGCADVIFLSPPAPKYDGKTNYCLNEPFQPVTILGPDPKWYYTETGGSPITPAAVNFNTTTAHKDTFWVSQTISGCESPRTMVVYSAAPKPNVPVVTTPTFYCENAASFPVNANGQELKWYYEPTGGIPTTLAPAPNTSAKDTFYYYVSQTVDGCESERARMEVIVTFRPNGLILASRDAICQGDTLTLGYYGSAFPQSTYAWDFPPFDGVRILDGSSFETPLYLGIDSAGVKTIKLTVGHSNCWSETYTKNIRVDPVPTADIEVRPNICQGQTELVSLRSYTSTVDSFFWAWDGGYTTHYSTDQGPYGVIWNDAGKKYITLRLVDELCSATITDSTYIHAKPDATFKVDGYAADRLFCIGDSILMTANTILPAAKYSWTPSRFFDTYSSLPVTYARIDYKSYVKLSVTDEFGCFNSDSVLINTKSCCEIGFPTAFTPNNDGRNDLFRPFPQATGNERFVNVRTFKVVNRYGQVVYETANTRGGWDGTLNGKPQDAGTYFYYINFQCDGKSVDQKGEVILVR